MRRRGFSLMEILVAVIIIGILATIAAPFFRGDYKEQKVCASNLRIIYNAFDQYRDATGAYPPEDGAGLKGALYPNYISNEKVFTCPANQSGGDSYSIFYVKPNDYSAMNTFVVGCPRHEGNKKALDLFFQGQILKHKLAPVTSGGNPVQPGDTVSGTVNFADGTQAVISGGSAIMVQSFYIGNNRCYSILKATSPGTIIETAVTDGSRFEVITPSAVAGVGGTEFIVAVVNDPANPAGIVTYVGVRDGSVNVIERRAAGRQTVTAGEISRVNANQPPRPVTVSDDANIPPQVDIYIRKDRTSRGDGDRNKDHDRYEGRR